MMTKQSFIKESTDVMFQLAAQIRASRLRHRRGAILILEDNEGVATLFEKVLTEQGREVVVVAYAKDALQYLEEHYNHVALISADISLPDGDGVSIVAEMRRRWPQIPVLICSVHLERFEEIHNALPDTRCVNKMDMISPKKILAAFGLDK